MSKGRPAGRLRKKRKAHSLYDRQRGTCFLCGGRMLWEDASRHHVVPSSAVKTNGWRNIVLAHRVCNSRVGSRPPTQEEIERFKAITGVPPKFVQVATEKQGQQ